jgi:uncharacterized protein YcbK (DUF882 family)
MKRAIKFVLLLIALLQGSYFIYQLYKKHPLMEILQPFLSRNPSQPVDTCLRDTAIAQSEKIVQIPSPTETETLVEVYSDIIETSDIETLEINTPKDWRAELEQYYPKTIALLASEPENVITAPDFSIEEPISENKAQPVVVSFESPKSINEDSIFIQSLARCQAYRKGNVALSPTIIEKFRALKSYLDKTYRPGTYTLYITSGVRTPKENWRLGKERGWNGISPVSQHLTGDAIDFYLSIPGVPLRKIIRIVRLFFDKVVANYKDGHIHVQL